MGSRSENEKQRQIQDKCQVILGNLLREEDNKYCVDCDAKGPRWASWNLGIFLCIRCAGIHRNLGVHISKVKSVNLDTWTPEQVACLQQMGNSQARAVYEANLPDNFRRPQSDPPLEAFVRSKYEQKKYIAKEWVPPPPPKPAFDIEEERKKQKERKKTRPKGNVTCEIPVLPQHPTSLPRPQSTSQNSANPLPISSEIIQKQVPDKSDNLLNLGEDFKQPNDDIFDVFLSAPPSIDAGLVSSAPATSTTADGLSTTTTSKQSYDTSDLFKEMVIPNAAQSKMTKESILSLYGGTQNQQPQAPQPQYGFGAGMYVGQPNFTQINLAGYAVPTQPMPSGISNMVPGVPQIQQQMANLQLQGRVWNGAAPAVAPMQMPGMIIATDPVVNNLWSTGGHGTTLSNNIWQ